MKSLLFVFVLVFGVSACGKNIADKNENNKQAEAACTDLAKFAEQTMKYHQSNVLMSAVFKEVDLMSNVPEESKVVLKNIVIDAYKQPVFTDQSYRDRQVIDFANDTHLKCLEIME